MIESLRCDIWRLHPHAWIVIPTNLGWTMDGYNVMGAGLAKQASQRFKGLAKKYGEACRRMSLSGLSGPIWYLRERLIMFPVKPLLMPPHLSWRGDATLDLIERSAAQLQSQSREFDRAVVAVPLVGCGNGKLREEDVLPILRKHLDDRFILVRPPEKENV